MVPSPQEKTSVTTVGANVLFRDSTPYQNDMENSSRSEREDQIDETIAVDISQLHVAEFRAGV